MLIKTKLAIQDKTRVFLAGRSKYIVAVENDWLRQRFFTPLRKIYFCCLLIYVRIKRHFPLISPSTYFNLIVVDVNIACIYH